MHLKALLSRANAFSTVVDECYAGQEEQEEAAATAGQAVELTMQLDRTLQQAYVEIDELRQALRRRTSPTLPSELTEHAHESSKPVRYTC